nr:hypothetical protein [Tanacetum cinerariifolium]
MKLKSEALKERTKVSRPIKAFTVYPPNTPATLVPKLLPTTSQVKIHIFTLIQQFLKFDKTCKKRFTPTAITDGERGFEQTKACYLQEVIPFFKTIKDNFEGNQKALTKEVKEMKDVFEELEAEVAQCAADRKHDAIDQKNLLIANDNLVGECLSKEVFSVAAKSKLNVARFAEMHVANTTVEARCLALEAKLATLRDKSHQENQGELIKHFSKLELPFREKTTLSANCKSNSKLQVTSSDTERTIKVRTTDSQLTKVTDPVTNLQAQNDLLRAENDKVKQHYKELNNRDAHLDYLRHLKESVKTIRDMVEEDKVQRAKQLANTPLIRKKQVTIAKPSDRQDRVTSYPKASGSQPKSNPKTNRISPAKGANKLPVEDLPRTNKSHLRTSNRVDSSSRIKRT